MMRFKWTLGFVFLLFVYSSALGQSQDNIEGIFQDGKYKNDFIGFEFDVPKGWHVADKEKRDAEVKIARKELYSGSKGSEAALERNKKTETVTIVISKKSLGATRNSAFGLSLTKQPSELVTTSMIAEATKAAFVARPDMNLAKEISLITLGNRQFATFDLHVNSELGKQNLRVYITMVKEYALTFPLTYWDENSDIRVMEDSLRTIKFLAK